MKLEVESTANFFVHLLRLADCNIKESSLQKFHDYLVEDLYRLYRLWWFPENPIKCSNQRIIRINAIEQMKSCLELLRIHTFPETVEERSACCFMCLLRTSLLISL